MAERPDSVDDFIETIGHCVDPGVAAGAGNNWIIGTDSNSHSTTYGSQRMDLRGRMSEEFIQKHEFLLLNEGGEPTFERLGFLSHIDLTLCKSNVRHRMWGYANLRIPLADHLRITGLSSIRDRNIAREGKQSYNTPL